MKYLILFLTFGVFGIQNTNAQGTNPTVYLSGNTTDATGVNVPNIPIHIHWQTGCNVDSGNVRVFTDTTIYSNTSGYYFFSFPNTTSNNCTSGMNVFYISNDCGFAQTRETTAGTSYQYAINVPACANPNPCNVSFSYSINPNMVYTFTPSTTSGSAVSYVWEFINFNISRSTDQSPQAYLANGATYGIVSLLVQQNGITCSFTDTVYTNNSTICNAEFTTRATSAADTYQFIPNQNLSNVASYSWSFSGFNINSSTNFDPTASLLPIMPPINCGTATLTVTLNNGLSCSTFDSICTNTGIGCNSNFTYTQNGSGHYRFEASELNALNYTWTLQGFSNIGTNNRIAEGTLASGTCGTVILTVSSLNGNTCTNTQQVCVGNINTCQDTTRINRQIICPTLFEPVCGCDSVTYNNACEAENWYGITQYHIGPCSNTGGVIDTCRTEFGVQLNINNNEILFNGIYHSSPASSNVQYFWEFGDGTTGVGQNIGHIYANGGLSYQVCLTATGGNCSANYCQVVYAPIDSSNSGSSCAASFNYTGYVASNTNQLIYIFNPQTYGQQAASFNWTFTYGGQNFTSSERNPVIILPIGVNFISACLQVVYTNGCTATSCDQFLIRQNPFHIRGNISRLINSLREGLSTRGLQPETGVIVSIKDVRGTIFRTAVTDVDGNYDIPNLSEGDFVISLNINGYTEIEQLITSKLYSGDANNINYIIYDESNAVTGVQNINKTGVSKILLSPNPTNNFVNVDINSKENAKTTIQIISNTGKIILEESVDLKSGDNSHQLDMQKLSQGMYFIKVNNVSAKIIKL
jgi:hypothetical protein